jgi:hypothetical protein
MNSRIDVPVMLTALAGAALWSACGNDDGGVLLDAGDGSTADGGAIDGGVVMCDVTPTFTSLYQKIFADTVANQTCSTSGCHAPVVSGGLDMSGSKMNAYSALVNADTFCQAPCQPQAKALFPKRVVPGNAGMSFLYEKISKGAPASSKGGSRMPLGSMLQQCQIDVIKQWIDDGAMNN